MSNPESTWQDLLDHFTRNCSKDLLKLIHTTENVNEKINLCLNNEDVKKSIADWVKFRIKNNRFAKCAEKSAQLRQDGNKLFAGSNPEQAVDIYSKSILVAPEGSEELRLSYGNLSAVLYHMEKFKDCISAIDKSLTSENEVHCLKLLLRKANALINLNKTEDAIKIIDRAESVCKVIENKRQKTDISKFKAEIAKCRKSTAVHLNQTIDRLKHEEISYKEPHLFINPNFPFASQYIELKEDEIKGRYVMAKKNLKFGTILFSEKPVAFVVLPPNRFHYCNHCCHKIKCPIPCQHCSGLAYCSETCRDSAVSYHSYECGGGLSIAYSTGIAHLAMRLALIHPLDPIGYSRSSKLLHHLDKMPPEDIFNYSLTGFALSYYLEQVNFPSTYSSALNLTLDIGRLIINGHSIYDIRTSDIPIGTRVAVVTEDEVATAIYPSASMMNHACSSNIANCFYGQCLIVKANQEIKSGAQVYNCYGVDCMRNARKDRKEVLKSQYKFECDCKACTADVDPNETFTAFACLKCSGPVVSAYCLECSHHQPTTKETIRQLKDADEKYSLANEYFRRDWPRALEILEEVLETRIKYLYRVNKDIGLVYDRITKCHSALGNYERAYTILKDCSIPRISQWYGPNSIELANVMNNCINVFCSIILSKYGANSPDCDVQDSVKVSECVKMIDQVELLYDLYYGQWSDNYRRLMRYKNFLVPLSQVWQHFLQVKGSNINIMN